MVGTVGKIWAISEQLRRALFTCMQTELAVSAVPSSFLIWLKIVVCGAERLMYFVAEGRTDEADVLQAREVNLVLGEVIRDEFSVIRDQGDAVSLK